MKRFTETCKWDDPWFRRLSMVEKLVFLHLTDTCNNAGFLEYDPDAMAFKLGCSQLEIEGAIKGLERGIKGASGWLWVKNFLKHQKNDELNPANPAHKQIISLLKEQEPRFGQLADFPLSKGACKGLKSPIGNSKGKGEGQKGSAEGEIPDALILEEGFEKEWDSFREHRQRLRKPMTLHACGLMLSTLSERPAKAAHGLKIAMEGGWTGFRWDWYDNALTPSKNGKNNDQSRGRNNAASLINAVKQYSDD